MQLTDGQDLPNIVFNAPIGIYTNHTQHISGSGIGLYLSTGIIHRYEGKIWVESENGTGSVFYFSLPLHNKPINEKEK